MATRLSNLNMSQNELQNARIQNLATAPASPVVGQIYHDTALVASYVWNGTAWRPVDATKATNIPLSALATDPLARANHTGTQLAATVSNLAATVQAYSLSTFAAPTADIALAGFKFTGAGTPTAAGHVAEYSWVIGQIETAAAGISSKPAVRAVATANVASLSGTTTIDGVSLVAGNRVLLTGQTTASQNGPYVVAAGAWTRPAAVQDNDELITGALWLVTEGTANSATQWRVATTGAIVPGTTAVSIVQFGAGSSYTAGNGITLTGSAFSVNPAASGGISVAAGGVSVDTAVVVRKVNATIGDGAATSINVVHNLGTRDVQVQVVRNSTPWDTVEVDVSRPDVNSVTLGFTSAPAANAYRASIQG